MWAGAHIRPIPATTPQLQREAKWLKETTAEFQRQIKEDPWVGITHTTGVELLDAPDEGYRNQNEKSFREETGLGGYRKWEASELPEGVTLGYEYETYCVNSPLYCQSLLRKFILRGGKTLQADLHSEWEVFGLQENILLVINASGTGFGDSKYFPTRGMLTLHIFPRVILTLLNRPDGDYRHGGCDKNSYPTKKGWKLEFHHSSILFWWYRRWWNKATGRLVRQARHPYAQYIACSRA